MARETTETMLIGGYEIPPGVSKTNILKTHANNVKVLTSTWVSEVQRDPRIWPDAETFIPERWLGDYKGVAADRKAFMPFSGGSRVCIGQQ
jgi:cytochrome P450